MDRLAEGERIGVIIMLRDDPHQRALRESGDVRGAAARAAAQAAALEGVAAWTCGGGRTRGPAGTGKGAGTGAMVGGRARLVAGRDEMAELDLAPGACGCPAGGCLACAAVEIRGSFALWAPRTTHRDFLGAALGCGLERSVLGDLFLIREGDAPDGPLEGAHLVVDPEMVPFLEEELTQVGRVTVVTREIPLGDLRAAEPRRRVRRATVPALRLDAVLAAGFGVSRARAAEAVRRGRVQRNWELEERPAAPVREGDALSCRGLGRLEVGPAETTAKGRVGVELARLV